MELYVNIECSFVDRKPKKYLQGQIKSGTNIYFSSSLSIPFIPDFEILRLFSDFSQHFLIYKCNNITRAKSP